MYMEFYFLPHSKHTVSALQTPSGSCCVGRRSDITARITRKQNARILIDKQVVHIVTVVLQSAEGEYGMIQYPSGTLYK